jgi:hypothetical protein
MVAADPVEEAPAVAAGIIDCRRRTRNCRQTIGDLRAGAAIASSARNKSAMRRRPQFRMPPSRSSWFPLASNRRIAPDCALQKSPRAVNIRRQMWQSRSLNIQAKCGTFAATDRFIAVLVQ